MLLWPYTLNANSSLDPRTYVVPTKIFNQIPSRSKKRQDETWIHDTYHEGCSKTLPFPGLFVDILEVGPTNVNQNIWPWFRGE